MSRSAPLNLLFDAYKADPVGGLEPLLTAIRIRAINALQDEDDSQDFLVRLLPELPRISSVGNFSGWISVRLRWHRLNSYRDNSLNREVPASYVDMGFDEDGAAMSNDDKLSLLAYRDNLRRELPVDLTQIADPTLRTLAELLLHGYTQAEAAEQMGVSLGAIKQRLFRHRKKLPLAA